MIEPTVVRDRADYPNADAARASLPEGYGEHPYAGVWLQPNDPPEYQMYVFSTLPADWFAEQGWDLKESA